ncbi:MAG: hypothetical protein HGJ98_10970 [Desulfosporosinus sp.]|nr:hypothetical protein [Desulfosporosinus sp.]MBC2726993.1 hypothetical protein [Desulfosporosinus sp.]
MAFIILSLLDGTLTLWGLVLGAIEEVNPVMEWLIGKSPIVFMAVKLMLPVILGFIFWKIRNRSRKFVTYSLGVVLIAYAAVMVLHVHWLVNS